MFLLKSNIAIIFSTLVRFVKLLIFFFEQRGFNFCQMFVPRLICYFGVSDCILIFLILSIDDLLYDWFH